ncbi:MAG: hypothetical protein OCD02_10235 [Spirochaetaceae bacterium]
MKYILQAKSSSGKPYKVEIGESNGLMTAKCSCPAGVWGKLCKHKMNLLKGDQTFLFDISELDTLKEVEVKVRNSSLYDLIEKVDISTKCVKIIEAKKKKDQKKLLDKMTTSNIELELDTFKLAYSDIAELEIELAFNKYVVSRYKSDVETKFKVGF